MACGDADRVVQIGEVRSGEDRDAHQVEVPGGDGVEERLILVGFGPCAPFDREGARRQAVNLERHEQGDRRAVDAGQRAQRGQQPGGKRAAGGRAGSAAAEIVRGEQHAVTPEARVRAAGLRDAAVGQPGEDEHHQRETDLDAHERVPQAAAARGPCSGAKRALRIDARQLNGGERSGGEAARDPQDHREREAHAVHARLKSDRQPGERQRDERRRAPHGDDRAQARAGEPQQDVLRQQQAGNSPRTRAERQAHAHFALTRARPRQHEVRGVPADGEQQEQHDALQDREPGHHQPHRPARRPQERQHLTAERRVRLRVGARQLPHDAVQIGLRLGERDAALELSHHGAAADGAIDQLTRSSEQFRRERGRQPDLEVQPDRGPLEFARRDPRDREPASVDAQGLAEHAGVAAEAGPPQPVRDDDRGIVRRYREAPDLRLEAKRGEIIVGDQQAVRPLDLPRLPEVERHAAKREQIAKRVQPRAQVVVLEPRYAEVHARVGARFHPVKLRRAGHAGQRLQQPRLDPGKDDRVDADAGAERHDDHRREQRHARDRAGGVPDVTDGVLQPGHESLEPDSKPKVASGFSRTSRVSKPLLVTNR